MQSNIYDAVSDVRMEQSYFQHRIDTLEANLIKLQEQLTALPSLLQSTLFQQYLAIQQLNSSLHHSERISDYKQSMNMQDKQGQSDENSSDQPVIKMGGASQYPLQNINKNANTGTSGTVSFINPSSSRSVPDTALTVKAGEEASVIRRETVIIPENSHSESLSQTTSKQNTGPSPVISGTTDWTVTGSHICPVRPPFLHFSPGYASLNALRSLKTPFVTPAHLHHCGNHMLVCTGENRVRNMNPEYRIVLPESHCLASRSESSISIPRWQRATLIEEDKEKREKLQNMSEYSESQAKEAIQQADVDQDKTESQSQPNHFASCSPSIIKQDSEPITISRDHTSYLDLEQSRPKWINEGTESEVETEEKCRSEDILIQTGKSLYSPATSVEKCSYEVTTTPCHLDLASNCLSEVGPDPWFRFSLSTAESNSMVLTSVDQMEEYEREMDMEDYTEADRRESEAVKSSQCLSLQAQVSQTWNQSVEEVPARYAEKSNAARKRASFLSRGQSVPLPPGAVPPGFSSTEEGDSEPSPQSETKSIATVNEFGNIDFKL
ncbi:unnamed protein product [Protopolystoma xenopodis]|uniref:Uncharacterized protein n=1 Tax=Protopolystoma xenopodis TaxID=117903 RepID=A0A448XBL1_9PLAT|nr:unnamed protein product [Protopolystoma xenopodis]